MSRSYIAFGMLGVISAAMIIGFSVSPGPQKSVGLLIGWSIGVLIAGVLGRPQFIQQYRMFIELAVFFVILSLVSLAILFFTDDEEFSSIDGLLVLVSTVFIALAVPFAIYGVVGWNLSRKRIRR